MNKRLLNLIVLIIGLIVEIPLLNAQQLPTYTQYKLNAHVVNPAISGASGYTSANITARNQWLGFEGSPQTYTLSGEWRLLKRQSNVGSGLLGMRKLQGNRSGKVGLGGVMFRDNNGAVSRTGFKASYAFHIKLYQSQLSFGLAISAFQFKVDKDQLEWEDAANEPIINKGFKESIFSPDASIGVYYMTRNFYAGLSSEQLFQSIVKFGSQQLNDVKILRHYYVMSGYKFIINRDYDLEPSFLMKVTEPDIDLDDQTTRTQLDESGQSIFQAKISGLRLQSDINMRLYYQDDYWGGVSYRTNGDLVFMGGVRYEQFYIGYSFEHTFSKIRSSSSGTGFYGTHEISLGIKFGSSEQKYKWRNRF